MSKTNYNLRPFQEYFSLQFRNPGHWDVGNGTERIAVIRGDASEGRVSLTFTESHKSLGKHVFKSVNAAMAYIVDIFTYEQEVK